MFTGLIEEMGTIARIEPATRGSRLTVRGVDALDGLVVGESIAVDGVCLTAVEVASGEFVTDVSPETIARSNQSTYQAGTRVNLERSLRVGDRLGGHIVQGHVDAAAQMIGRVDEGDFVRMEFSMPDGLRAYLVEKGSVAINGVSLTVARRLDQSFDVALIPKTLEITNLGDMRGGARVNIEVDILGKYVAQLMSERWGVTLPADDAGTERSGAGRVRLPGIELPGG